MNVASRNVFQHCTPNKNTKTQENRRSIRVAIARCLPVVQSRNTARQAKIHQAKSPAEAPGLDGSKSSLYSFPVSRFLVDTLCCFRPESVIHSIRLPAAGRPAAPRPASPRQTTKKMAAELPIFAPEFQSFGGVRVDDDDFVRMLFIIDASRLCEMFACSHVFRVHGCLLFPRTGQCLHLRPVVQDEPRRQVPSPLPQQPRF
jgi:hypothetical protein